MFNSLLWGKKIEIRTFIFYNPGEQCALYTQLIKIYKVKQCFWTGMANQKGTKLTQPQRATKL